MRGRRAGLAALVGLVCFAGVCDPGDITIVPELDESFSFEGGLQGWAIAALDAGALGVDWDIAIDGTSAVDGQSSVRFSLDDGTGAGRLWIERGFTVTPEEEYRIDFEYSVGTEDPPSATSWRTILGASGSAPSSSGQLSLGGALGVGAGSGVTWVAHTASVNYDTVVDQERAWVAIGIAADTPGARTYRLDGLRVTFTRR